MSKRVHLIISGEVQGVSFRYYTKEHADNLGVKGYVRNLPEGKLGVVIEGEKDAVNKLVEWCKKGPSSANVNNIEIKEEKPTNEFKQFEVRTRC